jgi:hypothetical protein
VSPHQNVNAARIYKAQALAINQQMFGSAAFSLGNHLCNELLRVLYIYAVVKAH